MENTQGACLGIQFECLGIGLETQVGCLGIRNECRNIQSTRARYLGIQNECRGMRGQTGVPRVRCLGIGSAKN